MSAEFIILAVILVSLILYALTGGADFGGGVWDLLAHGPRDATQRAVIREAIAPIWEANHVWLILAVVLLFTAFPLAFSVMATALHLPLFAMLLGIVLRGSAFVFRSQASNERAVRRWSYVFSIASLVTPVFLGITVGALASGAIRVDATGQAALQFWAWARPFPALVGAFTLLLFAYLGAVYLTLETEDAHVQNDFRVRALASGIALGALAWACLFAARAGAPRIYDSLSQGPASTAFHLGAAAVALASLGALVLRRYHLARACSVALGTLIILGWGAAQYPYLIYPDVSITTGVAPNAVLRAVVWALALARWFYSRR